MRIIATSAALCALLGGAAARAWAQAAAGAVPSPTSATPESEATVKYREGLELLRAGKAAEALLALEASRRLSASPNAELLIGHALRQLGRRVEAIQAYERVVESGGERARAGEERFRATVADAGRYFAVLKTELAELHASVVSPPPSVVIKVDGVPVEASLGPTGALTARVWHEPGTASIEVTAPATRARIASASLVAGATREVSFDFGERRAQSSGPPAASLVAAGVGVAGAVVFVVFGAIALSEKSDLETCSPRCPASQYQDEADRGQTHQAIANVGLVVAGVGLATAGVLWIVARRSATRDAAPKSSGARSIPMAIDFGIGPGALKLEGCF